MPKKRSYDRTAIKKLDEADWASIVPRLIKYARAKKTLLSSIKSELDYKDLVQEAIARVYGQGENGKYRNWNSEKYPNLAQFLTFIINEIVHQEISNMSGYKKEQLCWEDNSGEDRELPLNNFDNISAHHPLSPETLFIKEEEADSFSAKLDKISNEDEEIELVILCVLDGKTKSSQIANELNLPIQKVYNLKRKLKRRLTSYNNVFTAQQ